MPVFRTLAPSALSGSRLLEEARREGFAFLDRLVASVAKDGGAFSGAQEIFLGARQGRELIAVGGVSRDPYGAPASTGRLRHLYVRRPWRGRGVGRELVNGLVAHGAGHFHALRLRTDTQAASRFYIRIGFRRTDEPNATHRLDLRA